MGVCLSQNPRYYLTNRLLISAGIDVILVLAELGTQKRNHIFILLLPQRLGPSRSGPACGRIMVALFTPGNETRGVYVERYLFDSAHNSWEGGLIGPILFWIVFGLMNLAKCAFIGCRGSHIYCRFIFLTLRDYATVISLPH